MYDVVILDFFCDIQSLNVKIYLSLKLYTVPFFVSGQPTKSARDQIIIAPTVYSDLPNLLLSEEGCKEGEVETEI